MEWHVLGLLIGEIDSFQMLMAVSILNKQCSADWWVGEVCFPWGAMEGSVIW